MKPIDYPRAISTARDILSTLKDAKADKCIEYHSKQYDDTWSLAKKFDMEELCAAAIELYAAFVEATRTAAIIEDEDAWHLTPASESALKRLRKLLR